MEENHDGGLVRPMVYGFVTADAVSALHTLLFTVYYFLSRSRKIIGLVQ